MQQGFPYVSSVTINQYDIVLSATEARAKLPDQFEASGTTAYDNDLNLLRLERVGGGLSGYLLFGGFTLSEGLSKLLGGHIQRTFHVLSGRTSLQWKCKLEPEPDALGR